MNASDRQWETGSPKLLCRVDDGVAVVTLNDPENRNPLGGDLRPLLRAGATLDELQETIREAIGRKPERHEFTTQPEKVIRFMSYTGG